ncbi:MAG TPA: putative zinc-binding peptidase [Polyangia bacterium]
MRLFTCAACGQTLYFENNQCTRCGRPLAFLPDRGLLAAVRADDASTGLLVPVDEKLGPTRYRPCGNQVDQGACNWAVPESDEQRFCRACRLNRLIPNLTEPGSKDAWLNLERAKRRLLYTLSGLRLPIEPRGPASGGGLAFSFARDEPGAERVLTGHNDGIITINIAEADAPFRERIRQDLGEPYRTLLGHFRHEIGHYYWSRLVDGSKWQAPFGALFGDPAADYAAAVKNHYDNGPPADWPNRFVSTYASTHPWEDWAESWAHYLHMIDTLETARSFGLALQPAPTGGGQEPPVLTPRVEVEALEGLLGAWVPLTLALNSLNRSMGLPDPYPFVLPPPAIEKLRLVHDVIRDAGAGA